MYLISNIFINSFSIMMLCVICVYAKRYSENSMQNKIYMMIVNVTVLLLILDVFSRLDGYSHTVYSLFNQIGNFLVFLISPLIPSLWTIFVYYYIYRTEKHIKSLVIIVSAINAVNVIMVLLTLRYGWFYYIDQNNIYHRGPLYSVSASFTFLLLFIACVIVAYNRRRIESKHYYALLLFAVPPVLCIIFQIIFLGFSFIYNGVALSALIIFLYVQSQDIFTDYLTGIANRKKLELYLKKMISDSTPHHTFSAIMMDLDHFKKINDTLGHKVGDEALQAAAGLLRNSLGKKDFIARYGGDEFCVVLDTSDITVLKDIVKRIHINICEYNESKNRPYRLGLSMGYAIYEYGMSADEYQNMIDQLMYKHKQSDHDGYRI